MKICTGCKENLEESKFNIRKASADGLSFRCKDCRNKYRKENDTQRKNYRKEYYAKNKDIEYFSIKEERKIKRKEYYEKNKERTLEVNFKYRLSNPHIINALSSKRRAAKLKATPSWSNKLSIENLYLESSLKTKITGIPHNVDHIVPLISKKVCGLHWEGNMQVITRDENFSKNNHWWPDMW